MKNDKNFLQAINMLMQVVIAFFDIFFSIFVYEMSNDLTFIFSYLMFQCFMILVASFVVIKILSEKNYLIIYRLSFLFILLSILLNFTISSSSLYMVFVVQTVYAISIACYYIPHEVSIMNKNNDKTMSTFVGIHQILTLVAGIISPFISGFLIDYISYPVLFGFIMVLSAVCFVLSFKINKGVVNEPKIKFFEFAKQAHKIKHIRHSYFAHSIYKASQGSVVNYILPILLFMKLNTNFSVGIFSAVATAISGVVLILITKFFKPKKVYIIVATSVIIISSFAIVLFSSLPVFFIYYFSANVANRLLAKYDAEMVYVVLSGTTVEPYKKEHHFMFNNYDQWVKILTYAVALLIYTLSNTILTLSIIIFVLTILQIFSSYFMIKSDTEYHEYLSDKENREKLIALSDKSVGKL